VVDENHEASAPSLAQKVLEPEGISGESCGKCDEKVGKYDNSVALVMEMSKRVKVEFNLLRT